MSNNQAKSLSEAFLVQSAATGWTDTKDLSQDAIDTLLTALSMDGSDPLEVALATQMIASHCLSVQLLAKANKATHADTAERHIKAAAQLMNLYTRQIEGLMKYRKFNKE